jgi:hypothetical protein
MTKRKQTPDVLAEILGGETSATLEDEKSQASPRTPLKAAAVQPASLEWEYRLVSFQDYKGWRPRYQDGRELKDWTSGPLIHEYLRQMAAAGWELAAASAGERLYGTADSHQLYFKKLKSTA